MDELISIETSVLAKKMGFNEETEHAWRAWYGDINEYYDGRQDWNNPEWSASKSEEYFSRPTQTQLHKWIREKHGIYLLIIPTITANWTFKSVTVISERDDDVIKGIKSVSDLPPYSNVCGEDFSTPEKALESGLTEALKQIVL